MPGGQNRAEVQPDLSESVTWGPNTKWILITLFVLVAGVVLFYELGDCRSLGSHEGYAAVPAREMIESGDWTVPTFGGIPRLTKPPLAYWILAAMGTVYGELNEWLVRLPAAVCALLLALLIGHWAGRWYGRTAGWAAAFAQLTPVYIIVYCRKAEIDMLVWLGIACSLYLVANQLEGESRSRNFLRWTVIFAIMSVCWLAKFHYGPAMFFAPVGLYYLIQKRWKSLLNFLNPVGLAMLAAAIFIWPWLVLQEAPQALDIWQHQTVGRATGKLGYNPIWYYVPIVLWFTLPWTGFFLAAAKGSWRRAWKQGDARERFLWVWFLTQFAIVTAQPNKHVHYIIAALPVASMLAAQQVKIMIGGIQAGRTYLSRKRAITASLLSVVGVGIGGFIATMYLPFLNVSIWASGVVIGCGVCSVSWLTHFRRLGAAGVAFTATFLVSFVIIHTWIVPKQDHRLGTALFAQESRKEVGDGVPVVAYKLGQTPIVYYLDSPVVRVETTQNLRDRVRKEGRVFILAEKPDTQHMAEVGEVRIIRQMQHRDDIRDPKHPMLVLIEVQSPQYVATHKSAVQVAKQHKPAGTSVQ